MPMLTSQHRHHPPPGSRAHRQRRAKPDLEQVRGRITGLRLQKARITATADDFGCGLETAGGVNTKRTQRCSFAQDLGGLQRLAQVK